MQIYTDRNKWVPITMWPGAARWPGDDHQRRWVTGSITGQATECSCTSARQVGSIVEVRSVAEETGALCLIVDWVVIYLA